METTLESIQRRRRELRRNKIEFEPLEDGDFLIVNGQYRNLKLSDMFLVNPAFVQWLIEDERFDYDVRTAALDIMKENEIFSGSIMREIVTHEQSTLPRR